MRRFYISDTEGINQLHGETVQRVALCVEHVSGPPPGLVGGVIRAVSADAEIIGKLRQIEVTAGTLIRWQNDPNLRMGDEAQGILDASRELLKAFGCAVNENPVETRGRPAVTPI